MLTLTTDQDDAAAHITFRALTHDQTVTATITALEAEVGRLREADAALRTLPQNWEISFVYTDEEGDGAWTVHKVTGGRNDREWTEIGSGQNPLAAIRAALKTKEQGE